MNRIPFCELPAGQFFWRQRDGFRWYSGGYGYVERLDTPGSRLPPPPPDEVVLTDPLSCGVCWSHTVEGAACPVCNHQDPERASPAIAAAIVAAWTEDPKPWY